MPQNIHRGGGKFPLRFRLKAIPFLILFINKLKSLKDTKKVFEDSDSTLKEKYEIDISDFKLRIANLTSELNELENIGKELTISLEAKRILHGKYCDYLLASSKLEWA